MRSRPSKDEWYLKIARVVSEQSTCLRSHYGAVLVKDGRPISFGFNGAPSETDNCCDLGECQRDQGGERRYGRCRAVHSEENALHFASPSDKMGSTIYIARDPSSHPSVVEVSPCYHCRALLVNNKIARVVCLQDDDTILEFNPKDWLGEL